jgi:DNA-binding response OmpR family regulator/signal transduction histidine kinase
VLVAEDERVMADAIAEGLRRRAMAVDVCYDGDAALERVTVHRYDVVVLDRDLPKVHGDEVCRAIVAAGAETRVLMLTAAAGIRDRVDGLDLGADDYLTKPFAFAELAARVGALGRRARPALPPVLERAGIRLNRPRHSASRDGLLLSLTPKEFAVLDVLMRAEGTVVSPEELLEKAWDENADPFTNAVRVAVMTLRRKLGDPPVIETVAGAGYRIREAPSLQRRLTLAFLGAALADALPLIGVWNTVHNLWFGANAYECAGLEPWLPGQSECSYPTGMRLLFLPVIAAVVLLLLWLNWLLAGVALQPLRATTETVHGLGPQNMSQRIALRGGHDELKELSDALDGVLDRLAVGHESQRRFAANASHELRTPVAVQRVLAEVAMEDPDASADLRRLGTQLLRANERSERLIEGLLVLAESDRGLLGKVPVRLDELACSVLESHAELAEKHKVELRERFHPFSVPGDPVLLERLIANLVANAIVYNQPGGWAELTVGPQPAIIVSNTGQQVPAEQVGLLFEPFRRLGTDRVGHAGGVGLGLSIVRSIAAAHQGAIRVWCRPAGGMTIAIDFPAGP